MSTTQFDEGRLMQVLVAPVVSEKATMVSEKSNVVTFKVLQGATKPEIKDAVELMFKVKVKGVAVLNVKGKRKRFGAMNGRRSDWRKAYVSLEAGQEIDFLVAEIDLRRFATVPKAVMAGAREAALSG